MSVTYRPDISDYFPKTRRGHGTTHPTARFDKAGKLVRNAAPCVNETCALNRTQRNDEDGNKKSKQRGEAHSDVAANVLDWKSERRYGKDTPLEFCR